jgi:8-oxo-dGTP diphosphatase
MLPRQRPFSIVDGTMSVKSPLPESSPAPHRQGAVAVIVRERRLLVIERSQLVRAPGMFCFPGGGIELGEDPAAALERELQEELNVAIQPLARLWSSTTAWNVQLHWWLATMADDANIEPNLEEVAAYHWFTVDEIRALPRLLTSNHAFLDAWEGGQFSIAGL